MLHVSGNPSCIVVCITLRHVSPILRHVNQANVLPTIFDIHFNIILPPTPESSELSLSFSFPYQSAVYISFLHYKGNNPRPNPQVLKFPFMQLPPNSYLFLFLGLTSASVPYCRTCSAHVLRKETKRRIK